jgi:hypothetical protein
MTGKVVEWWTVLRCGGVFILLQRDFFKEEEEIGRGEEGRWPGHILIIIDGFTDIIIVSVNPSAILSL